MSPVTSAPAPKPAVPLTEIVAVLIRYRWRWLLPALLVITGTATYAYVRPNKWEASQALMVRNETAPQGKAPGRFLLVDEMKALQETLLEVAASRKLLEATLKSVGPPKDKTVTGEWPSDEDVQDLRTVMTLKPPKGTEFGKTEVFYLKLNDPDKKRAVDMVNVAFELMRESFGKVRKERADSLVTELQTTAAMSRDDLNALTAQLTEIEKSVGSDLGELRSLNQSATGGGELARTFTAVQTKVFEVQEAQALLRSYLTLLEEAKKDPLVLVAAPNALLQAQTPLMKLREGLVAAQLRTNTLLGKLTEEYPTVKAGLREEEAIREDIFTELEVTIRAVNNELESSSRKEERLMTQHTALRTRMERLGGIRAQYANLSDQVGHRRSLLEAAERDLAEARATRAATNASSLICRIELPEIGTRPVPPSRLTIVLVGVGGGLVVGLGVLLLTAPKLSLATPVLETPLPYRNGRHRPHEPSQNGNGSVSANGVSANGSANGNGHHDDELEPLLASR